jgi:hypothetical protein
VRVLPLGPGTPPYPDGAEPALVLHLPEGAVPEPAAELPAISVPNLPGAHVVARVGYQAGAVTLRAACLAAPASGWAPGVEEIVLARATQIAREALGDVSSFTTGDPVAAGPGFEQRFAGTGTGASFHGRHWLGFAGDPREGIVCTTVGTGPAPGACAALIDQAVPGGAWTEAPPPNLLARALLLAAERPREAVTGLAAVSLAAAALIVMRRPRPRALTR